MSKYLYIGTIIPVAYSSGKYPSSYSLVNKSTKTCFNSFLPQLRNSLIIWSSPADFPPFKCDIALSISLNVNLSSNSGTQLL